MSVQFNPVYSTNNPDLNTRLIVEYLGRMNVAINGLIVISSGAVVPPPSSSSDLSTLPGGVLPTGNQVYFANRDANTLWVITSSDTQWKIVQKAAL
jgi:hypothetical protein